MPKPNPINPFREFFHKEHIDFHNLDEHTLVIFDTNTLLNIYRYSNNTRDQLITAMEKIKSNIWIPYQVGLEFNLQRRQVWMDLKSEHRDRPESAKEAISEAKNNLKKAVRSVAIKSIDAADKKREIENFINERLDQLQSDFISKFNELDAMIDLNDDLAAKIASLFSDKIGECYTQEDLDAKLNDADVRYTHKIPPGYKDVKKDSITYYNDLKFNEKYGDLIVWYQIIDKAQEKNINKVVFVTDDNKEDWWYIYNGKTIGPRAELKNELLRKSQADFYMFNTNSFLSQFSGGKDLIEPTPEQITLPSTGDESDMTPLDAYTFLNELKINTLNHFPNELDINDLLKAETDEEANRIISMYELKKAIESAENRLVEDTNKKRFLSNKIISLQRRKLSNPSDLYIDEDLKQLRNEELNLIKKINNLEIKISERKINLHNLENKLLKR